MTTKHHGTITTWKDDKGFGFITPDDGGNPIFFHISGLAKRQPRPTEQAVVTYALMQDERQRKRAINIHLIIKDTRSEYLNTVIVVSLFFLALFLGIWIIPLTPWIFTLYGVSSIITYGLYALDKARAQQHAWRISEDTLHLFELVGGWPGAILAQKYQHHKTVKSSYQREFKFVIGSNLVLLSGYIIFILFTQH